MRIISGYYKIPTRPGIGIGMGGTVPGICTVGLITGYRPQFFGPFWVKSDGLSVNFWFHYFAHCNQNGGDLRYDTGTVVQYYPVRVITIININFTHSAQRPCL
jgi:hypothetical protein